jgi:hypothetical protein
MNILKTQTVHTLRYRLWSIPNVDGFYLRISLDSISLRWLEFFDREIPIETTIESARRIQCISNRLTRDSRTERQLSLR